MPKATTAVIRPACSGGMPKIMLRASAAPTNSARSVAIATASACTHNSRFVRRPSRARHISGRLRPVARPSFEDRYCTTMAIRFDMTMTHTNR